MHRRTAIRKYVKKLLKNKVDVGDRIYCNRPSPIFLHELPCVLIFFTAEPVDIIVGDTTNPKEYQRNLRLNIDVITDEPIDPDLELNESDAAEDVLDAMAWQVEMAMADDWTLSKLLPGYDPNAQEVNGLSMGTRLVSTDPYNIDTDSERRLAGQRLQFEVPYETPAYTDKKYTDFLEYLAEFYEVKDGEVVDNVLTAAEGKVRQ